MVPSLERIGDNMNYHKLIIRLKDGSERCIVATGFNFDMRSLIASIWVGYGYRAKDSNGIVRYYSDVDETLVDLTQVQFIAELREQQGAFDEIIYIYGKREVLTMPTNRTEYNDMCNTRENVRRALKSIHIALSRLKEAEKQGYTEVSIRSDIEHLEKLKSILNER